MGYWSGIGASTIIGGFWNIEVHFDVVGRLLKAAVESWDSISNFPRLVLQSQVEWLIFGSFRFWVWQGSANQPLPPQQT